MHKKESNTINLVRIRLRIRRHRVHQPHAIDTKEDLIIRTLTLIIGMMTIFQLMNSLIYSSALVLVLIQRREIVIIIHIKDIVTQIPSLIMYLLRRTIMLFYFN